MNHLDVSTIDANLATLKFDNNEVEWISAHDKRFSLHGVYYNEGEGLYMRVPDEVSDASNNPGYRILSRLTAGGRLRFVTNSKYISIKAAIPPKMPMPHMSITGSHGFSVYADGFFRNRYSPVFADYKLLFEENPDSKKIYFAERKLIMDTNEKRVIDVYFPLYGGVCELFVGVDHGSIVEPAPQYVCEKPLLFYGSSITQGGCVSRPGNDYVSILGRRLNMDYLNLGFSGNGNAEAALIDYINSIDAALYAFDYNYYSHRKDRVLPPHFSIYERIREKHPDTPILLYDKPGTDHEPCAEREEMIRETYEKALKLGDKKVGFVPARALLGEGERDCCMVDVSHPNDLGAMRMADALYPVIKKLVEE